MKLTAKLADLEVPTATCNWILDFLTDRPQVVRMGKEVSAELTVRTGTPQGCCLSSKLFSLYTHDCSSTQDNNTIIKYTDDTTILGLIRGGDESLYRDLVHKITVCGEDNDLVLNIDKTKELILDFRRRAPTTTTTIKGTEVERTDSYKFKGLHIPESLSWAKNTATTVKRAQQRLHFIRLLKKARLRRQPLTQAYRGLDESILTSGITEWFDNTTLAERKLLQRGHQNCREDTIWTLYTPSAAEGKHRASSWTNTTHALFKWVDSGYNLRHHRPVSISTHKACVGNSFFPSTVNSGTGH